MTSYDDIAFTAMCMWEWHIATGDTGGIAEYRSIHGACEARSQTIDIARLVEEAFSESHEQFRFDVPFDWVFIPEVMERLTLDDYEYPTQKRVRAICRDVFQLLQQENNDDHFARSA